MKLSTNKSIEKAETPETILNICSNVEYNFVTSKVGKRIEFIQYMWLEQQKPKQARKRGMGKWRREEGKRKRKRKGKNKTGSR